MDGADVLKVERPFYEQQQFNSELNYCRPDDSRQANLSKWFRGIKPMSIVLGALPIFSWLSQYNIKNDLTGDIVAGRFMKKTEQLFLQHFNTLNEN